MGYRKFTTTRVAEHVGVSVGSLYQYFSQPAGADHGLQAAIIDGVIGRDALHADMGAMVRGYLQGMRAGKPQAAAE